MFKWLGIIFGDRLSFHGAIDVQQMLPNASTAELEQEVARRVYDLGRHGGYILAPCHNIGHDIPPENRVSLSAPIFSILDEVEFDRPLFPKAAVQTAIKYKN